MTDQLKILIVEDEAIVAEDMRLMLKKLNYVVTDMALNYQEAVDALEVEKPDLVLIDIQLNEIKDGIQLADFIKREYQLPFIFVTSNADEFTVQRAKKIQPAGYLVKPFEQRDLYAAIEIARANFEASPNAEPDEVLLRDALFIRQHDQFKKVLIKEIVWLKADGNYTNLHTESDRYVVRGKVKEILEGLNKNFVRIHKSYAINLSFLESINQDYAYMTGERIPIGKTYRDGLLGRVKKLS
jgi:two-component system response regulator LytT